MNSAGAPSQRLAFLDQLRGVLILLVVFHHTAIAYGGAGSWYYREVAGGMGRSVTSTLLTLFCAVNQAYFMGAFFLIAGYVTPASFDRKGVARFLIDRVIRLGVPLLVYMFFVDGLTVALAQVPKGDNLGSTLAHQLLHGDFGPGPLWFVEALFLFSVAYAGWRLLRPGTATGDAAPLPSNRALLLAAIATGAAAFAIRMIMPVGREVAHMQLAYFASYVMLFAVGCAAWRHHWLERIDWQYARPWWFVSLVALPVLPVAAIAHRVATHEGIDAAGGFNVWALLYAFWEPFVAWGVLLALLWFFRARVHPDRLRHLGRRAYAIYCFHPPVIVAISVVLRYWEAPAALKFLTVGALSCGVVYMLAGLLLRVPVLARIW